MLFSVLSIPSLTISTKLFVKKRLISVFNQTAFFLFFMSGINNVLDFKNIFYFKAFFVFKELFFRCHWLYLRISISTKREEGHLAAF